VRLTDLSVEISSGRTKYVLTLERAIQAPLSVPLSPSGGALSNHQRQ
jgi:hypothetical protein